MGEKEKEARRFCQPIRDCQTKRENEKKRGNKKDAANDRTIFPRKQQSAGTVGKKNMAQISFRWVGGGGRAVAQSVRDKQRGGPINKEFNGASNHHPWLR